MSLLYRALDGMDLFLSSKSVVADNCCSWKSITQLNTFQTTCLGYIMFIKDFIKKKKVRENDYYKTVKDVINLYFCLLFYFIHIK